MEFAYAGGGLGKGGNSGAPVSPDYRPGNNRVNGAVKGVQLAIGADADKPEHQVDPKDVIRLALARQ